MASSSAHDITNGRRHVRKRADSVAWSMPGHNSPKFAVSNKHGLPLEEPFIPLARALFKFDLELIARVRALDRKLASTEDEASRVEALHRLSEWNEIKEQWKDIQAHKYRFSDSYLRNDQYIAVWARGLQTVRTVLGCKKVCGDQIEKSRTFEKILLGYERQADHLQDALVDCVVDGILGQDILNLIRERWMRLDETLSWYYAQTLDCQEDDEPSKIRNIPTWREISYKIREANQKNAEMRADKERTLNLAIRSPGTKVQSPTAISSLVNEMDGTLILWLTFLGSTVASVAFFAIGYAHSPHIQGSLNDPDFWFLAQCSVMQIMGLATTALLEWNSGSLSKWR